MKIYRLIIPTKNINYILDNCKKHAITIIGYRENDYGRTQSTIFLDIYTTKRKLNEFFHEINLKLPALPFPFYNKYPRR